MIADIFVARHDQFGNTAKDPAPNTLLLPFGLSVEADALYRPPNIKLEQSTSLVSRIGVLSLGTTIFSDDVNSWEFPILAKYRLPVPIIRPYLEAGPCFRAVSASLAKDISGTGVAAGIEANLRRFRIAPEIRYTHWATDGAYPMLVHATSTPNQIELWLA